MKENNEYIYVVLVRSLTKLGILTQKFTKYEYTHIAVCLDHKLNDFITFSRRKHYCPFDCGFMHETLDCYAFGKNKSVKLKVFKVPVSYKRKKLIKEYINKIEKDDTYIFNLYSMITMPIIHGFKIYKSHNCMSFVAKILELSKSINMKKKYYKYNIKDLDNILSNYLYKEDYFLKEETIHIDYMDKISNFTNIGLFLKLNARLIFRLVIKGKNKNE